MTPRRYQVRGLLGEGAFGAVYLAQSVGTGLQRQVAIKVLHRDRSGNKDVVGRLRDEARMLALIRHRAIVRVDDLIELEGSWSIVMEYVEGCDVAALMRRGPLPPAVALAIAEEIANALHAAWNQVGPDGAPLRLIHRDVKPSNIRLTAQGEVKLLDFGVARAEFAEREAGTTQSAFGTIVYMAPERFDGKDSHEADVYALGVSLFEMLTGASPGRIASDPGRQPPGGSVARQWAGLAAMSTELHALLARMLAYDPTQRPNARDCARALGDLRAVFREERIEDWAARVVPEVIATGRPPLRADSRTGTLLIEGAGQPAPAPAPRRWGWVAGGLVALAGLGVTAVVGGGLLWWAFRDPPSPEVTNGAAVVAAAPAPGPPAAAPAEMAQEPAILSVPTPEKKADPPAPSSGAEEPTDPRGGVAGGATPPPQEKKGKGKDKDKRGRGNGKAASTGTVRVLGDASSVTFEGPGGKFTDPSSLPAGDYTARVTFPSGAQVRIRDVPVRAGSVTLFTCSAAFSNCTAIVN